MKVVPKTTTLCCIVCGRELDPAFGEEFQDGNQPFGGTVFVAHGQYGSTVFDPMNNNYLEVNICDGCLVKATKNEAVIINTPVQATFWDGEFE